MRQVGLRAVELREHILGHLVTPGADTRFGDPYVLRHVAVQASRPQHEVAEVLRGLVGEGLAYIDKVGQGSSTDNWRWRASARGIRAATTGRWEPHDPDGHLRRLRRAEPGVDAFVHLEEALRAFNARCCLASSVMLGVASERVVNELALSMVQSFGG